MLGVLGGSGGEGKLLAELRSDVAFHWREIEEILLDGSDEVGSGDGDAVRPNVTGAGIGTDDGKFNGGVHLIGLRGGAGDAVGDGADHFLKGRFSNHSCESF